MMGNRKLMFYQWISNRSWNRANIMNDSRFWLKRYAFASMMNVRFTYDGERRYKIPDYIENRGVWTNHHFWNLFDRP